MNNFLAVTRRQVLQSAALGGFSCLMPSWTRTLAGTSAGNEFDLEIGQTPVTIDGRRATALGINGTVPGPLIRLREGERAVLNVHNALDEDSSIHWHGLILPSNMDGVPGLSYAGIGPGETYRYEFDVVQNGTYWYHSHSGLQEQLGVYGPLIIDAADEDPVEYDIDYVVMLSDWTFENPYRLFSKLKKQDDYYNRQQRTLRDLIADIRDYGLRATAADRGMWGHMRMAASDIADVTAQTYTYLMNGLDPVGNWTGQFDPGQRVRLRLINGSAMTFFNLRIPGLEMTVVQHDGQNVEPVTVDELQLGVAETCDVVVQPTSDEAFTIFAETMDRSGYARGTLAPRPGMSAPIPELRERPLLTMADMGMDHAGMDHSGMTSPTMENGGMDHSGMDHSGMNHSGAESAAASGGMDHANMADSSVAPPLMDHSGMDHSGMDHGSPRPGARRAAMSGPIEHDHARGPGVANVTSMPTNRLDHPGIGLEDVSHRTLTYADLKSLAPNLDRRAPERELELHLTGNMERYMWSFDGVKYSHVEGPIVFQYGERIRMVLVNDTMMAHPIHLHGMFVELDNGNGQYNPRKHTITVKPGERLAVNLTADAPGRWAFHCHMLYHMKAGMMREVRVVTSAESVT
jgi:CopA family copper-resistance protein